MKSRFHGYALALVAAVLWATLGLFYRRLAGYELPALTIAFLRAALAALILLAALGWWQPAALRLARRDLALFVPFGLFGVAAFYIVYIYAIERTGMGIAAVLMYTAPIWVTLFDTLFAGEPVTRSKLAALLLAVSGCALVSRAYDLGAVHFDAVGILLGLGAGIAYGTYTLFSKALQRRYSALTTLAYALGIGALFLLPLQKPADLLRAVTVPAAALWALALALLPTLGGGVAFNAALRRVPASHASIVATLEPAVAMLLGRAVLGERLEGLQVAGGVLIVGAVLILQTGNVSQGAAIDLGREHGATEIG